MNDGPKGKFWYSEKQKRARMREERPALVNRVVIDGREVEYTEWRFGSRIDEAPEWDDAVYLGEVR